MNVLVISVPSWKINRNAEMTNFKNLIIAFSVTSSRCEVSYQTYLSFQHICSDGGKTKAAETTGQGNKLGQHSSICKLPLTEVRVTNFLLIPPS